MPKILSKYKRDIITVDMDRATNRKNGITIEPKNPIKPGADQFYNVDADLTRPKIGKTVPNFSKQVSRVTDPYGNPTGS